ncbi:MAG TPA: glutathione S-transferase N-terminal domain-containing protein [Bacteriovoracaceae bacterium]|nr:glutathione S-transferase N-terminal domain-containing protein [Bacteriovoracaceae bacterium]
MKTLELYYFPQCPFCQIVLSAMRVTGIEAQVELKDVVDDPHNKQRLIKDTGKSTVPCLYIDGKPMHESKDIANWIHQYAKEIQ